MTSLEHLMCARHALKSGFGLGHNNAQRNSFLLSERAHSLVRAMDLGPETLQMRQGLGWAGLGWALLKGSLENGVGGGGRGYGRAGKWWWKET